jgi:biopolymer transport protein TolR
MAYRQYSRKRGVLAEINVVPYIDVMLVLLVIFMITAPLLTQGVNVQLPKAQAKAIESQKELPIVLSVNAEGQYFLNIADQPSQAIDESALMTRVAAALALASSEHSHRPVYVKGDQRVDYGKVVAAMALLQQAGADQVGLITDPQA